MIALVLAPDSWVQRQVEAQVETRMVINVSLVPVLVPSRNRRGHNVQV